MALTVINNELAVQQLVQDYEMFYGLMMEAQERQDIKTVNEILPQLVEWNNEFQTARKEDIHRLLYPCTDFEFIGTTPRNQRQKGFVVGSVVGFFASLVIWFTK